MCGTNAVNSAGWLCDSRSLEVLAVVPTYNGGAVWRDAAAALAQACRDSRHRLRVKVIDSSSHDDTVNIAIARGFGVERIDSAEFDHGGTRNLAVQGEQADLFIFLTQDAILSESRAIDRLVASFDDPVVAVAYGRQLPHSDANPIAAHARRFNYPDNGHQVALKDRSRLGIKTVFTSNSFAAYRSSVFMALGGFTKGNILSEDMLFAARAVMAGHHVAYVPEARVLHSHNYSPMDELRRYFDIGVFHHDEAWIGETFGGAGGEGLRFMKSEWRQLWEGAPLWLPRACLHNALKFAGFQLGKHYRVLPGALCRLMSMHRKYWEQRR